MFKSINRYIIKEFLKSLLVVLCVMFSIVLLITLLEEFNYFKSKQDLKFITFLIFLVNVFICTFMLKTVFWWCMHVQIKWMHLGGTCVKDENSFFDLVVQSISPYKKRYQNVVSFITTITYHWKPKLLSR
mgnify:CR=1 FL=1